jgi:transposase
MNMTDYREILRLQSLGINNSQIADSMAISRPTVITALQRAAAKGLDWASAKDLSDKELAHRLYSQDGESVYTMPDYEYVHKEMAKSGVTLQLLWFEYSDKCRDAGQVPYQFTQFKKYYRDYVLKSKATMHINHKPGEIMEVDWAGQTAHMVDADTGEIMAAYVFVAVLPYSGYAYAEAFSGQKEDAWISGHVNAYNYFGGVTRILVPDNLKTGVIKHSRTELVLNKSYQEMAEYYGTAIIPTRVRAPKDKATVEGAVGNISTFILAAVRNQKFFSLRELNEVLHERLHRLNHKPFQKKEGSRATAFANERTFLLPLPMRAFELAIWKTATVQYNYHVSVEQQFYSVPYEYIKRQVDIRITRSVVEVFFENMRICSHVRLYGHSGQYRTLEAHMPQSHQKYMQWNGERFRSWAAKIGEHTAAVVEGILTTYKVEQQGYRACMAILKMADTYNPERLEAACAKALRYTPRPPYKAIQTILKTGQDKLGDESPKPLVSTEFGFTRGSEYYGKGDK